MSIVAHDMTATRRVVATAGGAHRVLPEEVPVAIVVNGSTLAVMMATPADLADFARGFLRTEGIATDAGEVEIVAHADGIEARLWLPDAAAAALDARRRAAVGPVGCGLCGIDSLAAATRALPVLPDSAVTLAATDIARALDALRARQPLHDETHAVHAAGFWQDGAILHAREDVGRHNALDKLAGALLSAGIAPDAGVVVLTSRLSLDMVQKTVQIGAPILISVSAPTAHAVRVADAAGLTLATRTRGETHVYTHPHRIEAAR